MGKYLSWRFQEIRKLQGNLKIECRHILVPNLPLRNKRLAIVLHNSINSAINLCMKNLHFPDFLNYSLKVFCEFFSEKQILLFYLVQTLWNINFVQVLGSLKVLTRLNFIFRATEMWQIATFGILQRAIFLTFTQI